MRFKTHENYTMELFGKTILYCCFIYVYEIVLHFKDLLGWIRNSIDYPMSHKMVSLSLYIFLMKATEKMQLNVETWTTQRIKEKLFHAMKSFIKKKFYVGTAILILIIRLFNAIDLK